MSKVSGRKIVSRAITLQNPAYRASSLTNTFEVSAPGVVSTDTTVLSFGQGFTLIADGISLNITATSAANQEKDGRFNSGASIVKSINETPDTYFHAECNRGSFSIESITGSVVTVFDINTPPGLVGIVEQLDFHAVDVMVIDR